MTRKFGQLFDCPYCGKRSTLETEFSRWTRNNHLLESVEGQVIIDQDVWVHRFKTALGRKFQCLMLLEVKVFGAEPTLAQRDTLHIINQVTRNRRETPTKKRKWQAGNAPLKTYSAISKGDVVLKCFGTHVLRLSNLSPNDSEWLKWNKEDITEDQLVKLLRFDLDPDTLKPMDFRKHHISKNSGQMSLEDWLAREGESN